MPVRFPILYSTIIFLFFSTFSFSSPQKDTLIFGGDQFFPPYEFLNKNGQAEGFNIDIIRELAREMNVEIIVKLDDWVKIRKELEVDRIVDFSDMFYGEVRDSVVDYAFPHDVIYNKVFLHKSALPILSISELFGKKVAVRKGSVLEDYLQTKFPDINLIPSATESDAIKMVSEKLCDAAIVSNASGKELLRKLKIDNVIGYGNMIMPSEYSFVVKEGNSKLLKEINLALANLITNGTIEKIRSKWFDERVFGIRLNHIKVGIIVLLLSLLLSYLLNFSLNHRIRKSNNQLRLSDERWNFALEGSGDGVWDWNLETNEVFFSTQWKEMLGYSENDIANTLDGWDKLVHPADKEMVYVELNKQINGETQEYKYEYRMLCKDGTYKWILDRGKVMGFNKNGKPIRLIGTHSDISERKKAENELQESNEKLKAFLNNSMDAMIFATSDGKALSANPAACKMLELTEDEICKLSRKGLVDTNDPRLYNFINQRAENGNAVGELTMLRKGNNPFQVEISSALFKNREGITFSSMIIRDITERIKTQEVLRANEERFRLISGVASDYMFESQISEDGNLELVWTFGAFENITGYKPEEYIANGGWRASIYPDDLKTDDTDLEKLQKNQRVVTELRTYTKKGDLLWVRVYAHPIWDDENQKLTGIYGAVKDITERRNAEEALTISEEKFRKAFKTSPDFITLNRFSDGTYLEINKAFEKAIGYTQEEIIGKSSIKLNIWKNYSDREKLVKGLEENGFVENLEAELISKNGKILIGLLSSSIIDVNNEKAILSITRDISERKKAEEEIRKLNDELEEKVAERTSELEIKISEIQRLNDLFIGRELRMKELKRKIKELENSLNDKTNN